MPRPTRRARLTAPGLSARLLRVRKVMGSPSGCFRDFCDADDWARILDTDMRPSLLSGTNRPMVT